MIVKIPKKKTHLDCYNWRGIYMLAAIPKLIANVNLFWNALKNLSKPWSTKTKLVFDHFNTVQFVMEHCVEIRWQPHLLNLDFKWHDGTKCHVLHQSKISNEFEDPLSSSIIFLVVIGDAFHAGFFRERGKFQWTMTYFSKYFN